MYILQRCSDGPVQDLGPVYFKCQCQCCDDAFDSVLMESLQNGFASNSTIFNENRITSIIAALTLMLGVNGPLVSLSQLHHVKTCTYIL